MAVHRQALVAAALLCATRLAGADVGEFEGNYDPGEATHRSDFVGIVQFGAALGSVAGYPNEANKVDRPEFRADTGFGAGTAATFLIGFAPRDFFSFGIGLTMTSVSAEDKEAAGTNFVLRGEVFPLFYEGGIYRDLGLFGEFGAGSRDILSNGDTVAEGGFMSVVSGGAFLEVLHLGPVRFGPTLQYVHEFSTTLSSHLALAALRGVYYAGP